MDAPGYGVKFLVSYIAQERQLVHQMKTYTYSEARQRLATLLDQARQEGRVQIRRQDGSTFILQPVAADRSPLDVPGVRSKLRRGELTALVRSERERSGTRVVETLAGARKTPGGRARKG